MRLKLTAPSHQSFLSVAGLLGLILICAKKKLLSPFLVSASTPHNHLTIKIPQKTGVGISALCYWRRYMSTGIVQWLLAKPLTSSIEICARYCTGALPWPSKWPAKLGAFFHPSFFCCHPGSCRSNKEWVVTQFCPTVASSGLQCCPEHAELGDAMFIAPLHLHDHQNDLQLRYIHSSVPI